MFSLCSHRKYGLDLSCGACARLKGGEGRGAGSGRAPWELASDEMTEEEWNDLLDYVDRLGSTLEDLNSEVPPIDGEDGEFDDGLADSD